MHMPAGAMSLPVAIVCNSERRGNKLRDLLAANGVSAKLYTSLNGDTLKRIDNHAAAVIVDLDGATEAQQQVIDKLVSQENVPVLFNDGSSLESHAPVLEQALGEQIAKKIFRVSNPFSSVHSPFEGDYAGSGASRHETYVPEEAPRHDLVDVVEAPAHQAIQRVWVLGASLGGPDAVKRFVGRLSADVPAVFILAQHIGAEHTGLLRDHIDRVSDLQVIMACSGHVLQHGQMIIAPMDRHFAIGHDGGIQLISTYTDDDNTPPSIDKVMTNVAQRFGARAGAVIFSGIGNDGVLGARAILENGGTVWTQAAESCVMRSMPDHVRNACPVDMDASPEDLADELMRAVNDGQVNDSLGFDVANEGPFNFKF